MQLNKSASLVFRPAVLALCTCLAATPVLAQTPPMERKWATPSAQVFIHVDMPPACDAATQRAINTWNAQGSRWTYGWTSQNYQTDRQAYVGRVTFAPQRLGPSVPGQATRYPNTGTELGLDRHQRPDALLERFLLYRRWRPPVSDERWGGVEPLQFRVCGFA